MGKEDDNDKNLDLDKQGDLADKDKDSDKENDKDTSDKDVTKSDDTGLKKALHDERARATAAEKKLKDLERSSLPELERFKSENVDLKSDNEKLSKENNRLTVAIEKGLSVSQMRRLVGDTLDELRTDADELLKIMGTSKSTKTDPDKKIVTTKNDGKKTPSGSGGTDWNNLLRLAAGRKTIN